jgi:hypothetical protein
MKSSFLTKLATVALAVGALTLNAAQISGEISFGGTVTLTGGGTDTATGIAGYQGVASGNRPYVQGGSGTGSYEGIAGLTPVNWKPFSFTDLSVSPLWAFEFNGINYSFQATSISIFDRNATFLDLRGEGIANIDGMDSTLGSWRITVNGGASVFTFGGNSSVPSVPDAGATVSLLGAAFAGMVFVRRQLKM